MTDYPSATSSSVFVLVFLIMLPLRSCLLFFFLMIRRPPRSTLDRSSAASDVYKRQDHEGQRLALIDDGGAGDAHSWDKSPVPAEQQIRGLGPIVISVPDLCLLYTSPSPRDRTRSRMPSSA